MRALSRRTLLRGAVAGGVASVGLPVLEAMVNSHGTAFAQGTPFPRRFGIWFFGNGVQLNRWVPIPTAPVATVRENWWQYIAAGDPATESSLTVLNQPGLREHISIVTGTRCPLNTGSVHNEGRCGLMTGSFDRAIGLYGAPTLPSADQLMADEIAVQRSFPFRSVEVGVSDTGPNVAASFTRGETSTRGGGVFLPMEKDPQALFDRLFGLSPVPRAEREAKLRSVVSAVRQDACALEKRLGVNDQRRLQSHLDALADLERRLLNPAVCSGPTRPLSAFGRINQREQLAPRNEAICKLLRYALECDLTRVFAFEFTPFQAATLFPGAPQDSHTLTHSEAVDFDVGGTIKKGAALVNEAVRFALQQFGVLLNELKQAQDPAGGSVLEHSVILTATDVNQGSYHGLWDMPLVVAGGAGGRLKTGALYHYPQQPIGRAMLTAMRAAGSSATRFGTGVLTVERPFSEMMLGGT